MVGERYHNARFTKRINAGSWGDKYEAMCHLPPKHTGKCDDMPFLDALRKGSPAGEKAAAKIERDALLTKGIAWETVADTNDLSKKRPNRCLRWKFPEENKSYNVQYASYDTCLEVAKTLASMAYQMQGAPAPDPVAKTELANLDGPEYVCPICFQSIPLETFLHAQRSKAETDTGHYPTPQRSGGKHQPDNVAFVHHACNVIQGNRTADQLDLWMKGILEKRGFRVERLMQRD